jgi:hypothetical protein
MTTTVQDAILRSNFEFFLRRCLMTLNPGSAYLPNWHISAIAHKLERIRCGKTKRLIINMPPRHLKSVTVSVAFPAFLLGHEPWHRIFAISYGDELSLKHALDFRSIVESAWFRRAFSMRIARSLQDEVWTTAQGFRKATSVGGTLTGLGGDLFIIDDPQKPVDAQSDSQRNRVNHWFSNTLMSRLDSKQDGVIIVVMQRVHLNDLSGYLMECAVFAFRRRQGADLNLCSGAALWPRIAASAIQLEPVADERLHLRNDRGERVRRALVRLSQCCR